MIGFGCFGVLRVERRSFGGLVGGSGGAAGLVSIDGLYDDFNNDLFYCFKIS